ncbi:hypothetical protein [Allosalinactinospora lopnorensis]|uniref:hypothetical protein n=1 Tax=Allosalinactinospora lopnorensis TaxID=1352348 RepID=UPI000623F4C4|nr:hypothetical protein [Allosalinactinospora lopnorensis]
MVLRGRRVVRDIATTGGVIALLSATLTSGAYAQDTRHCIMNAETGEQECFDTLAAAMTDASTGEGGNGQTAMRSLKSQGEVIQGTFFVDENFGGNSLTIVGEAPYTDNDGINYTFDFPEEWQNTISSAQPWANCWLWLYPEPGLGGDRDGPFKENTPYVGDLMNDRTQSVGFS